MKGRDDSRDLLDAGGRENLSSQIRGNGMRDRVVGVDDVEVELASDLDQFVSQ